MSSSRHTQRCEYVILSLFFAYIIVLAESILGSKYQGFQSPDYSLQWKMCNQNSTECLQIQNRVLKVFRLAFLISLPMIPSPKS